MLQDSRVICRFRVSLPPATPFYPASDDGRFDSRLALITGVMDAGVSTTSIFA